MSSDHSEPERKGSGLGDRVLGAVRAQGLGLGIADSQNPEPSCVWCGLKRTQQTKHQYRDLGPKLARFVFFQGAECKVLSDLDLYSIGHACRTAVIISVT